MLEISYGNPSSAHSAPLARRVHEVKPQAHQRYRRRGERGAACHTHCGALHCAKRRLLLRHHLGGHGPQPFLPGQPVLDKGQVWGLSRTGRGSHALLATGYDKAQHKIFVNDPAGREFAFDYDELSARWSVNLSVPRGSSTKSAFVFYPEKL